jgi:putative FmdB family regulatory protein
MPFYEYLCQACGQHHEAMQKMSEAPLKTCPHCGKSKLKRLISAPVFRLKGGGWYETDFKSDKEAKRNLHGEEAKADKAEAGDKSSDTAAAKAETKVETKAEAKAEAKPEAKVEAKAEAKAEPTAASKSAAKSSARQTPARSTKPARKVKRRR